MKEKWERLGTIDTKHTRIPCYCKKPNYRNLKESTNCIEFRNVTGYL